MAETIPSTTRLALLSGFADALSDPCLIVDRRSIVLHRNLAAAHDFPAVSEGIVLTLALRNPSLISAIENVRRSGTAQAVELHQTVPNETWHRANIAPLPGEEGLLAVTLQNLTDHKRLEQLRTDFIANASHQLRTPLTSLVGFIDTLLGPAANDEAARERFLTIMRQQAGRMSALIDDLRHRAIIVAVGTAANLKGAVPWPAATTQGRPRGSRSW